MPVGQWVEEDWLGIFDDPIEAVIEGIKIYRAGLRPGSPNNRHHIVDIKLVALNCINSFKESSRILCNIECGLSRNSINLKAGGYGTYLSSYCLQQELVDTPIFKEYLNQIELGKKELIERLSLEVENGKNA